MIEDFEELVTSYKAALTQAYERHNNGNPFEPKEFRTIIDEAITKPLGVSLPDMQAKLCEYVTENYVEMASTLQYVAENNDWEKCSEEQPEMAQSILRGATKLDNWAITEFKKIDEPEHHVVIEFSCTFINDGNDFNGGVIVSYDGKIKHHYVLAIK